MLVVDDEPAMRRILRRTLEAENFLVEEAPDGETALKLIQSHPDPFDLVLTDLSMPVIDGRRVSETLTRYRPTVAVLCMSADPDAVPYIESSDTPVRVMLKPFSPDDLYHAVRDAITRVQGSGGRCRNGDRPGARRAEQAGVGTGGQSYRPGADGGSGHCGP